MSEFDAEVEAMKGGTLGSKLVEALMDPEWREIQRTKRELARVKATAHSAAEVTGDVAELRLKVMQLENDLLGLGLYTRTILQLLVAKGIVGTEEFGDKMQELDALDGKLDGK